MDVSIKCFLGYPKLAFDSVFQLLLQVNPLPAGGQNYFSLRWRGGGEILTKHSEFDTASTIRHVITGSTTCDLKIWFCFEITLLTALKTQHFPRFSSHNAVLVFEVILIDNLILGPKSIDPCPQQRKINVKFYDFLKVEKKKK